MQQMGKAYRETCKQKDGDEDGLTVQVESVFTNVLRRLPSELKKGRRELRAPPRPGEDYNFAVKETVPEFANPADDYELAVAKGVLRAMGWLAAPKSASSRSCR